MKIVGSSKANLLTGRRKVIVHFRLIILIKGSNPLQLTTEQLNKLYKLLESPTLSCSIATKGNSAFLSVSPSHAWIVDSGASDHMTGESTLFSSYSPCAGNQKIKIADGSFSAVAGKGSVVLSPELSLENVLHVPKLSCNLMSVSKLAEDTNCQTNFSDLTVSFRI